MTSATTTHDVRLHGCTPTPLAAYLKALAVLRLVAEQKDPTARGFWENDEFILRSSLDREALIRFLLEDYCPTPIVAPWNADSGFWSTDKRAKALERLEGSAAQQLTNYRIAIGACRRAIGDLGITRDNLESKRDNLRISLRNRLDETALQWLDAVYVIAAPVRAGGKQPSSVKIWCPPLVGTGGCDSRNEFSAIFMARLADVLQVDSPCGGRTPTSETWLLDALVGSASSRLLTGEPIGQFLPGGAGGANASAGYKGPPLMNPWDLVLAIEGTLLFAAAASRRLESGTGSHLAFPFTVHAVAAGHGAVADGDRAMWRYETWLPLWRRPTSLAELRLLLREGRAQVGRRVAADGTDFARAVARLGVDRGINEFTRVGFLKRHGDQHLAVPLGRWEVKPRPETELLDEIDRWLDAFRRAAGGRNAPASFVRAKNRIEQAILAVCREGGPARWQQLLTALGAAEAAMVASPKTTDDAGLRPLSGLSHRWLAEADDRSAEFRLARALASMHGPADIGPLRANMAPLALGPAGQVRGFAERMESKSVVWGKGDLVASMTAAITRRCLDARRLGLADLPLDGSRGAWLDDIASFINGEVNDSTIDELLWGLNAIRWPPRSEELDRRATREHRTLLPAAYSLLKLVHLPWPLPLPWSDTPVALPHDPETLSLATRGDMARAARIAARRLRSAGLTPMALPPPADEPLGRRIAAALLFPVSRADAQRIAEAVLAPPREQ